MINEMHIERENEELMRITRFGARWMQLRSALSLSGFNGSTEGKIARQQEQIARQNYRRLESYYQKRDSLRIPLFLAEQAA